MSIKEANQSVNAWLSHPETILKAVYILIFATVTMTAFLVRIQFQIDDINRYGSAASITALKEKEVRDLKQDQLLEQVIRTQASLATTETLTANRMDNTERRAQTTDSAENARFNFMSSALARICQKIGVDVGPPPQ